MNEIARVESLPRLIAQAAAALAQATTPAEILDARDRANIAYHAAKMADRLAKAKQAHDEIAAACRRAMGDALVIEAQADVRLADEYDAAQQRGEVESPGQPRKNIIPKKDNSLSNAIGLVAAKQVHEARIIRDAEKANPGVIRRTVEARLNAGQAPTRAFVRRAATPKPPSSAQPVYATPSPRGRARLSVADNFVLRTFAFFTIQNIDTGKLTLSGDPDRMRQWREIAAQAVGVLVEWCAAEADDSDEGEEG
jgi:hypothetical protein